MTSCQTLFSHHVRDDLIIVVFMDHWVVGYRITGNSFFLLKERLPNLIRESAVLWSGNLQHSGAAAKSLYICDVSRKHQTFKKRSAAHSVDVRLAKQEKKDEFTVDIRCKMFTD